MGSADVQVIVRQVTAEGFRVKVNVVNFDDLSYFGQLGDNWVPLAVLCVIDAIYLFVRLLARRRGNEGRMSRYNYFYAFWREQHAMQMKARLAKNGKPGFRKRTWTQLKAQHKLLRVFFLKFDLGDPPSMHAMHARVRIP